MKVLWYWLKRKVRDPDELKYGPPWQAKSVLAAGLMTATGFMTQLGDVSPALMRFGGSYIGGFVLGWFFRRFLKIAAVVAGVALLVTGFLKTTGWIALDWVSIEAWVKETMVSIQSGAEGLKQVLMGYLPSAGAGSAGIFFGFRKK